ncbi:hypothetical protein CEXT_26291 [Caerostris extrusa]|uniref:Uncharacterized protein n=1 Tax=Caerostris extrusa TaxID=172846 RepID=A0AAV4QPQ9_CAEEX|nr:hypothetical protein CEXT_26291 [Caerostris extrusa]
MTFKDGQDGVVSKEDDVIDISAQSASGECKSDGAIRLPFPFLSQSLFLKDSLRIAYHMLLQKVNVIRNANCVDIGMEVELWRCDDISL